MVFKIKTSKRTMQCFEEIQASTNYAPYILAKMSIAMSIKSGNRLNEIDFRSDSYGLELNRQTITGEWDDLFKALIEMFENKHINDDEIIKRAQRYLTNQKTHNAEAKPQAVPLTKSVKKAVPDYLTDNAKRVYDFLGETPCHIDEIINNCGLTTEKTLSAITELEIYGLVTQLSGRRYKI